MPVLVERDMQPGHAVSVSLKFNDHEGVTQEYFGFPTIRLDKLKADPN